jgi:hypothetical protein
LRVVLGICSLFATVTGFAQASRASKQQASSSGRQLEIVKTATTSSTQYVFEMPLKCDDAGNIYVKSREEGFSAIHKFSPAGERVASFAASTCPDIKVQIAGAFFVAPDGRVSQVVFSPNEMQPSILVFKDDGSCHSKIKLDTTFSFQPYQFVVLPSGAMLVSGLRWSAQDRAHLPYLGLFSASGSVLKEVDLADESSLEEPTVGTSPIPAARDTSSSDPTVTRGEVQLAADGIAYLMRSGSPTQIYAISQGGVVVRRFTIDPGDSRLTPAQMHVAGNRIAILFLDPKPGSKRTLLKIVDLHGNPMAEYTQIQKDGRPALLPTLACYSFPPDRFSFLATPREGKLTIEIAEPR